LKVDSEVYSQHLKEKEPLVGYLIYQDRPLDAVAFKPFLLPDSAEPEFESEVMRAPTGSSFSLQVI
jgi:hypothetical protein